MHWQDGELVYKVFSYFKREADAVMLVHDVAKLQERTAEACDISTESVQRIIGEGNVAMSFSVRAICLSFMPVTFNRLCYGTAWLDCTHRFSLPSPLPQETKYP
jgi:hypothetical protein